MGCTATGVIREHGGQHVSNNSPGALASIELFDAAGGSLRLFARCGAVPGVNEAIVSAPGVLSLKGKRPQGGALLLLVSLGPRFVWAHWGLL